VYTFLNLRALYYSCGCGGRVNQKFLNTWVSQYCWHQGTR